MINYEMWDGAVVARVQNPITRTLVKLNPAIEIRSAGAMENFSEWLEAYFRAAWIPGHLDPAEIDASNWRDGLPAGV